MKLRLSSLDIRAITNELNERLVNKYIQNFYSMQQRFMYIKFSNKDILLIEPGFTIHLSSTHETEISHFCKKLREKCRHARVHRIYQLGYDRVIIIDINRYKIVLEFFSSGNILILDEEDNIVDLLRPVTSLGIIKNTKYIWNFVKLDLSYERFINKGLAEMLPFDKEFIDLVEKELQNRYGPLESLKDGKHKDAINVYFNELETRIESLGGFGEVRIKKGKADQLLAFPTEEDAIAVNTEDVTIDKLADISINEPQDKVSDASTNTKIENATTVENLNDEDHFAANEICGKDYKVHHWDKESMEEVIKKNKQCKALHFRMFNEAVEFCFSDRKKTVKTKMDKSERIAIAQQTYIKELERQAENHENTAHILENNRRFISEILDIFKKVYENKIKWEIFEEFWESEKLAENPHSLAIHSFDLKNKTAIVDVDENLIELKLGVSINTNIDEYYMKRKKSIDKAEKTAIAMRNLTAKFKPKKMAVKTQKRLPYWFEKFNFFFSSENSLVIGGKNAQENEMVVKNHLEKQDLYFHCDVQGGSSVICKGKGDATINEASYMALCYSKCWEEGVIKPVFYVESNQVSKTAPTGEYLAKGGFIITGKKNYMNPYKLEYGLGLIFKEEESEPLEFQFIPTGKAIVHAMPICGPWSLVKNYRYRIRLCPGNEKKSQIGKNVMKEFNNQSEGSAEEAFVKAISIDEYIKVILGKAKIAKIAK